MTINIHEAKDSFLIREHSVTVDDKKGMIRYRINYDDKATGESIASNGDFTAEEHKAIGMKLNRMIGATFEAVTYPYLDDYRYVLINK